MKDYVAERWRTVLGAGQLVDFDALWQLEAGWFEEPNRRRGGWSGVSCCELTLPEGGTRTVFLKRQENHKTFSWIHPVAGIPTFEREFQRIMHYRACGIPTLEPVYFAVRRLGKGHRAILATEALTGFVSLEEQVQRWLKGGVPPRVVRMPVLDAVASLLRTMHEHRMQHNCFFPKHVFTRINGDGSVEARVIDLEKSRWHPSKTACALRDLYSLTLDSLCWSRTDRMRFLKSYLGIARLTPYAKSIWRRIAAHALAKNRIHAPESVLSVRSDQN